MAARSKGQVSDVMDTYVDNNWCISYKGTLYIRNPTNAIAAGSNPHPQSARRIGRIAKCGWSKRMTLSQATYTFVFKFTLHPIDGHQESSNIDAAATVVILKEDNFSIFEHDTKVKLQIPKWQTLTGAREAHNDAIGSNTTHKQGAWLIKLMKKTVLKDHDSDDELSTSFLQPENSEQLNETPALPSAVQFAGAFSSSRPQAAPLPVVSPVLMPKHPGKHLFLWPATHIYCSLTIQNTHPRTRIHTTVRPAVPSKTTRDVEVVPDSDEEAQDNFSPRKSVPKPSKSREDAEQNNSRKRKSTAQLPKNANLSQASKNHHSQLAVSKSLYLL